MTHREYIARLDRLATVTLFAIMLIAFAAVTRCSLAPVPTHAAGVTPIPSRQFVSIGSLVGQQPWRPHDPQHREPPKGWFCTNQPGVTGDHKCECQRTCYKEPPTYQSCEEDGENCVDVPNPNAGRQRIREDSKCSVFCHADHCACETKGCGHT